VWEVRPPSLVQGERIEVRGFIRPRTDNALNAQEIRNALGSLEATALILLSILIFPLVEFISNGSGVWFGREFQ